MPSDRCPCGRRLIHLDADGEPLEVPVCVYCHKDVCTCTPLPDGERT